jgi:hypothetical protein
MRFAKPNVVSAWVGTFADEADFERYIDWIYDADGTDRCRFAEHLGLGWFDHDSQEAEFLPAPPDDVAEFIAQFSYAESFGSQLTQTLSERQDPWNAILLLFDCEYDPGRGHPSNAARLQFVGSLPYDPGAHSNVRTTFVDA